MVYNNRFEISETVSITFENFDFVVAAFGKAIGNVGVKRVCYADEPVAHSAGTLFERLKTAVFGVFNPDNSFFAVIEFFARMTLKNRSL